jgi:hypothetical protein
MNTNSSRYLSIHHGEETREFAKNLENCENHENHNTSALLYHYVINALVHCIDSPINALV